jgi:hypothetical protein
MVRRGVPTDDLPDSSLGGSSDRKALAQRGAS